MVSYGVCGSLLRTRVHRYPDQCIVFLSRCDSFLSTAALPPRQGADLRGVYGGGAAAARERDASRELEDARGTLCANGASLVGKVKFDPSHAGKMVPVVRQERWYQ
jgi:hypothetical protein